MSFNSLNGIASMARFMSFPHGIVAWIPMSFLRKQESRKKYKYSKFLKLKARFISLYDGFPPTR
ncbi:MAG: hypothetical protein ACEY3D_09525 [Rickettsia sp.]|uniref:hypothetical protein n=1 Tax=Rickettsia sp. TaxID=789 RepID=UPI00397BDA6E